MNVVILNDTRADMHHGCTRVMRLLESGLARHGLTVTATSPVRHDWQRDAAFRSAMANADLIIINGEGTLHHGKEGAARLLSVVDFAGDTPVALINALYQDNPADWSKWLEKLSYIATRDNRSADEIASRIARRPEVIPDLTLSARIVSKPEVDAIIYGDSVHNAVSERLAALASADDAPLIPSVSVRKRMKGRNPVVRALRRWWIARDLRRARAENPTLELCQTEDDYAARIAGAGLHVTGRFHGVCYAMAARTPFVAVASNSWKIEALIADAGLAPWRVTTAEGLDACMARHASKLNFSTQELEALDAFLTKADTGAEAMFATLRNLAQHVP